MHVYHIRIFEAGSVPDDDGDSEYTLVPSACMVVEGVLIELVVLLQDAILFGGDLCRLTDIVFFVHIARSKECCNSVLIFLIMKSGY